MENSGNFVPMPRYMMRKKALRKILQEDHCNGKILLDIGYGAGEIFGLYRKLGIRVNGFDTSQIAYDYASRYVVDNNIQLIQNESQIPLKKYDYVVACEVLEHIEKDVDMLKKWKDYLRPNGKMIISVPAHTARWGDNDIYSGHFRRYEKTELYDKFSKAGMHIDKLYTYDFPSCLLLDWLRDTTRKKNIEQNDISLDRDARTSTSGVERNYSPIFIKLSHPAIWNPIMALQQLFYRTDWGSAYILLASIQSPRC